MNNRILITVQEAEDGERLDKYLAERLPELSRSGVQRLIEKGLVTLAGQPVPSRHRTDIGEEFAVEIPPPEPLDAEAENIPLDIIYEDEHIAIINKAAGMVVHPAKGHAHGTLVNALLGHCEGLSGIGGKIRPGIVHRIDKETTGLLAVAKNDAAHATLSEQLKSRAMGREYLGVVRGIITPPAGTINKPIGRHPLYRKKMSVKTDFPRDAVTLYETVEVFRAATLVRLKLKTGRTHQIRVHMSAVGHPLLGDQLYGKEKTKLIGRPALHAETLTLIHPVTGNTMRFTAPLPADFVALLEKLRGGAVS